MKDLRGWIRTVSLLLLVAGLSGGAHASTNVAFKWKANTEPDLAGYKLYYGTAPGTYTNSITLGKVINYRMTNLTVGTTYYFALSAFNTNDLESGLTPELQFPSPPVLAAIGNRTTPEDTALNVSLLVSDADTPLSSLTLSATSTNTTLVPNANVTFTGTTSNRTMRITPAANQSGTTRITVTVSDGAGTDSQSFLLTVSGTPDAPTISGIADVTTDEDVQTAAIAFTVSDQETPAGSLTITAASSNPSLIPTNRIILGGSGGSRTVVLRPVTNASGSATITLTVSDGGLSANTAFNFTVRAVNDTPTITPIADLSLPEDTQSSPIAFTIGDVETTPNNLQVTASSADPAIVPQLGFTLGGTGTNRTVVVRPATNAYGSVLITISVSDGQRSAAETFTITFTRVNDAPLVSDPADVVVNKFNPVPPVPFTIWDPDTGDASGLTITLTSTNTALLPTGTNMVVSGTGTNRTITLIPMGVGTTTVGINVSDGVATTSTSFQFTVSNSNNPPVITVPGALSGTAGTAIAVRGISVADPDIKTNIMNFTISAPNGTLAVSTTVTGGVTASQVSGNNSGTVTMIAPVAALNATFANANGLRYTSRTDFRGTETLVLTANDNGFSGQGGAKTDTENIAIQITGGATGIEGWRQTYFSAADLQDPTKEATVWGDLADPDSDGRENLMEYALGLNPLGSEPQDAAFVSATTNIGGNQYQTLTFNARLNDTTLQYIPEVSADNATWAATAILVSTSPVNADFQRVTYRDSVAIVADSARFMRLRVARNTP